ncbi:DUF1128 domain-containing protein [Staphylospora marina]|uniref:DUF1128 domain-containing protein n=1 Tax=Staphylospora marina TaxID=2490858 RepID=UPI000F5BDDC1|nr:DUF1128 family protein [Staphylospora marina]
MDASAAIHAIRQARPPDILYNEEKEKERMKFVDLKNPSRENLEFLIREIRTRLKTVNSALLNPDDFSLDRYDELLEIHQMIVKKDGRLSMMEIEGVLEELRELRTSG